MNHNKNEIGLSQSIVFIIDIATNRPDDQGAVSTISSTTHLTGVDPTSVSQSSTPHDPHLVTTVPLTGTSGIAHFNVTKSNCVKL